MGGASQQHLLGSNFHNLALFITSLSYRLLNRIVGGRLPALVSVAVVIVVSDQVLLIERTDGLGYSLPGGILRGIETLDQAAKRETQEETGLVVDIGPLIGAYSGADRDKRIPNVAVAYLATIVSGDLRNSPEGTPQWHRCTALPVDLAFDTKQILSDAGL
jgi:8-oxo-dGTP diphosphatase